MDANTVSSLIATLGFPIVCVIALAFFIWKIWESMDKKNEAREEKLYSFIGVAQATNEKLVQTNAEFVQVLNTYKSDLEDIKNDVTEIKERIK